MLAKKAKSYNFDSVKDIDSKFIEFQEKVMGKKPYTILIHAHWCGHCVALLPVWKKMILNLNDPGVTIVTLEHSVFNHLQNAHSEHGLAKLFSDKVNGFPYIANVETNSSVSEFNEDRSQKLLETFIAKQKKNVSMIKTKSTTKPTSKPTTKPTRKVLKKLK